MAIKMPEGGESDEQARERERQALLPEIDRLSQRVARFGEDPLARYELGRMLLRIGELEPAAEQLRRVVELAPDYVDGLVAAGRLEFALGELDRAEQHWRRALELRPGSLPARANLGVALVQRDDGDAEILREAAGHFDRALAIEPQLPVAWQGLIAALDALGLADRARQARARARELGVPLTGEIAPW